MMIECIRLRKAFGEKTVLDGFSAVFRSDAPAVITGPSGSGKTTLLRLIAGLETADGGEIRSDAKTFGFAFQENRLLPGFSAPDNIRLATGIRDDALLYAELTRLLPQEALKKPVAVLSGGEQKRVAIARACLSDADALLLDEPFAGLDAENAALAARFIEDHARNRLLILAAHEKDIPAFCRTRIVLNA